jgi:hypothetical protein
MANKVNKTTKIIVAFILAMNITFANADVASDAAQNEDRNIAIIFPPELMQQMLDQTTPEMMSNLKFNSDQDKSNTQTAVDKFHREFLAKFNTLVTQSLKQNFSPQEIAQWASFETTPLGKKTMSWLKTKYPGILNQAMDAPMQDLYKNLGGQGQ